MKWFWWSLLGFCLLMCSCRTKKFATEMNFVSKESIQTELSRFESLTDTSRFHKIEIDKSKLTIIETIKITEYDKESGKPIKETLAKRETSQDTDKVVAKEETKGVTNSNDFELNYSSESNEKVDVETEEESIGAQESFGKYFGMGLACVIGVLVLYLLRKLRVN